MRANHTHFCAAWLPASVNGIGISNVQRIAYRALTVYCTPSSDYQAARSAWISAAMDLNPNWAANVAAAWLAAGVSAPVPVGDALDAPGLIWSVGGNANWSGQTVVTHDGTDAAVSGRMSNRQECWFETIITGPGLLSFWWKVSSEAGFDYLRVSVDEIEVSKIRF